MQTIETTATVAEDGTITARGPDTLPVGTHRVVILLDERTSRPRLRDMAAFRARLGVPPYPGNTVVEMREEERC